MFPVLHEFSTLFPHNLVPKPLLTVRRETASLHNGSGLMNGALAVKMLVPGSSLPGVFVVLLPWLYCPIMWCLYNFAFQLIGDPFMLAGLLLLAYAPFVNVIVGEWKSISQPMSDKEILEVTSLIDRYAMVLNLLAICAIAGFVWKIRNTDAVTEHRSLASEVLE